MSERDVLPKVAIPSHYQISIFNVDSVAETFHGEVSIDLNVIETTDKIYLNYRDLNITHAHLKVDGVDLPVKSIDHVKEKETVIINLESPVDPTNATITLKYTAIIQTNMAGFYKSKYKDVNGNDAIMLSTQFEATDARRAFPSFDEPNLKATFDVKLTIQDDWVGLGNMPVIDTISNSNGTKTLIFDTTPTMSTYLIAWAAGDLEYIETFTEKTTHNGSKIPVRVYTTKGLIAQGQLALENTSKIVDYFSEIFDIDYALPKVDLLAVHEFSHGAMENWGLITYRTTALLYDETTSDAKYKNRVVYVVAHELAHQWFGNLVTMDWWNELWLNEGFATWVGFTAVDYLYPEWNTFSTFVTDALQTALQLDSLRGSHPIEVPVKSALEIDEVFDTISYLKGASTIRMLSSSLGLQTFLKGVSNYLKKHKFGNATTKDLWDSLTEVSGININSIMKSWIEKIGFPVLSVEVNDNNNDVIITQDRFLSTGDLKQEENETLWWIPLEISSSTIQSNDIKSLNDKSLTIPNLASNFFKINKNQIGVYRVKYPESLLLKFSKNLSNLTINDRIGLIADTAALASSSDGSTIGLFEFLSGFINESDPIVWSEIISRLNELKSVSYNLSIETKKGLNNFITKLITPTIEKLGWDDINDDYLTTQLKVDLLKLGGSVRIPSVVEESLKRFNDWVSNGIPIHPSYRGTIFTTVLINEPTSKNFHLILNEVFNPSSVDSREIALGAIGSINSETLVDDAINLILSSHPQSKSYNETENVPVMDIHFLAIALGSNSLAKEKIWYYIKENWDIIYKLMSTNMVVLDRFVKVTLKQYNNSKFHDDIEEFFKDKNNSGYERSLKQSLDVIKSKENWIKKDWKSVEEWFILNKYT